MRNTLIRIRCFVLKRRIGYFTRNVADLCISFFPHIVSDSLKPLPILRQTCVIQKLTRALRPPPPPQSLTPAPSSTKTSSMAVLSSLPLDTSNPTNPSNHAISSDSINYSDCLVPTSTFLPPAHPSLTTQAARCPSIMELSGILWTVAPPSSCLRSDSVARPRQRRLSVSPA